jgi:ribosome assembly protein YihI (activator of Der GTPase)
MTALFVVIGTVILMGLSGFVLQYIEKKLDKVKELEQELKIAKDDYEWLKIYYSLGLEKRIYDLELQTGLVRKL